MRELTVRLCFSTHCLGHVKRIDETRMSGRYEMLRNPEGQVTFLAAWWHSNMDFAAQCFGRHQKAVKKIHWDICVDGVPRRKAQGNKSRPAWYARHHSKSKKYTLHEAFYPGQVIGINAMVPSEIPDDDFKRLMGIIGQYRGISPYKPTEYGFFVVESVQRRKTSLLSDNREVVLDERIPQDVVVK